MKPTMSAQSTLTQSEPKEDSMTQSGEAPRELQPHEALHKETTIETALDMTALANRNSGAQTPFKLPPRPQMGEVRLTKQDRAAHREAENHGRRARVYASRNFKMEGWVHNGYFHVDDTHSGGLTHRELTGSRPEYQPIALSKIEGLNHRIEYLDLPEADLASESTGR